MKLFELEQEELKVSIGKYNLKETFYIVMIVFGLLALSFHLANAQTIRYWTACGVLHGDGRQCFEEVVVSLDSTGEFLSDTIAVGDAAPLATGVRFEINKFGWITDSIIWVVTDTTFEGDCRCEHDWVYGEPDYDISGSGLSFSCLVYHNGGHCEYDDDLREKICRKCLFSVIERDKWYQRFVAPPKSEFDILKEKQRMKR